MKKLFFATMALFFISCSQDQNFENDLTDQSLKKETPILAFENWDHFYEEYNSISHLSQDKLASWVSKKNHNALLNSLNSPKELSNEQETDLNTLTNGLLAILNKNQEFKIGEEIVYFTKGIFYSIEAKKISNKSDWKKDLSNTKKIGNASVRALSNENSENMNKEIVMSTSQIRADYQREFIKNKYQACTGGPIIGRGGLYKYVHELQSRAFNVGYPNVVSELYLNVKLEWRGRRWKPASEYRHITINVNGYVRDNINGNGPSSTNIRINKSLSCINRDERILLEDLVYPTNFGSAPKWFVSLSGTITQQINKDNNKWSNYVSW
ncbi:hypothetical protein [Aquimarina sediminis]|uniref:hypothetical protein n=1 Tax=Aquimarina sediminis TaxID=2070536 RepID=UPI000CA0250E|nr:hypothetical protein [Aquimarina sediminis]